MTYFSDFDYVDYRDDYYSRSYILQQAESLSLYESTEDLPEDLLNQFDDDLTA